MQWHDARTDPPKEHGKYLCIFDSGIPGIVEYETGWNAFGDYNKYEMFDVAAWAEIPCPPGFKPSTYYIKGTFDHV